MVRVVEYRICMPLTLEEYHKGSTYALAKTSEINTNESEGFETLENKQFEDPNAEDPRLECGVYTHKILHLGARVPKLVRTFTPKNAMVLEERCWNCFPYIKTVYSSNYFGKKFTLVVESMVVEDDRGENPNALGLSEDVLAIREIDYVDIVSDPSPSGGLIGEEDPSKFVSKKTGRGPLKEGFHETSDVCLCVYKVVTCQLDFGPFQKKAESLLQSAGMRDLLLPFHRQVWCWMDDWIDMTMEQVRQYEDNVQMKLNKLPFPKANSKVKLGEGEVHEIQEEEQVSTPASGKK